MASLAATLLRKSNMKKAKLIDTSSISSSASIYWSYELKKREGGLSFRKIQLKLFPDYSPKKLEDTHDAAYSRRLYKNSKGTRVRDSEIIIRAENLCPGTQRIIFHVLWDILERPITTIDEVYEYMQKLDIDCVQRLFNIDVNTNAFSRKKLRKETIFRIMMKNNMDALACILLLIRETELTSNLSANIWCRWRAHELVARLMLFSPFVQLGVEFIHTLYELFIENSDIPIPDDLKAFRSNLDTPNRSELRRSIILNLDLLKAMKGINSISSSDIDKQLTFLFWADIKTDKYLLLSALNNLPKSYCNNISRSEFTTTLDHFLKMIDGDSRRSLPRGGFY